MFSECAMINQHIRVSVLGLEAFPDLISTLSITRTPQIYLNHVLWQAPVNEWIVAQALRDING